MAVSQLEKALVLRVLFLQLRILSPQVLCILRLAQSKVGRDKEVSEDLSHAVLEEVATQALHHLLILEALEGLLEDGRELDSKGWCLGVFESALLLAFNHDKHIQEALQVIKT